MDYQRKEFKMIITDGYLRVITPIILGNEMIIIVIPVPVVEVISEKFDNAEYIILN